MSPKILSVKKRAKGGRAVDSPSYQDNSVADDSELCCSGDLSAGLEVQPGQSGYHDVDKDNIALLNFKGSFSTELRGSPKCIHDLEGNLSEHIDSSGGDLPVALDGAVLTQLDSVGPRINVEQCRSVDEHSDNPVDICSAFTDSLKTEDNTVFNANMLEIYNRVFSTGTYNYRCARIPIPSGLNIDAWEHYLVDYEDREIVDFLHFGWPSSFDHQSPLMSTLKNHSSGLSYPRHIEHYIEKEISKQALVGPFGYPPIAPLHVSPILTRPKKDSEWRRIVVDLSWPRGGSINDGIASGKYLGNEIELTLPTIDNMADQVRTLGRGCFLYKLDLSRGYRQLRLDPLDWPLMCILHDDQFYLDLCPPFGLRTAAMMMECTTMAVCYIHSLHGYISKPYIDDFGGAQKSYLEACRALSTLQAILKVLGLEEAPGKTCEPSTRMIWLGILIDSESMVMSIPELKLSEISEYVKTWETRRTASRKDVQSLMGFLNFVGGVSPPTRVYSNRILNFLREMPKHGEVRVTQELREDVSFFAELMPRFNGVTVLDKSLVPCSDKLEVDSCLSGCGGICSGEFYSRTFPNAVLNAEHHISHLEMLNLVVACRVWSHIWSGKKIQIYCDNMQTCIALQNGRSHDRFMQACLRAVFLLTAEHDIEILVCHRPGVQMACADALSRAHTDNKYLNLLQDSGWLSGKSEVRVKDSYFDV